MSKYKYFRFLLLTVLSVGGISITQSQKSEEFFNLVTDPFEMRNIAYQSSSKEIFKEKWSIYKDLADRHTDISLLNYFEIEKSRKISVGSNDEIYKEIQRLLPGDTLSLRKGIYEDLQLVLTRSGSLNDSIYILPEQLGEVFFSGDTKVEIRGNYNVLGGFIFKNGDRDVSKWKPHGPGLVAIYGSHNRITDCLFDAFDQANSAYITTSVSDDGTIPQYCRIDHCSFVNKITFDQVINLNNSRHSVNKKGRGGAPMYHRVDHNFFSNPRKPGNAGGAIRLGYYRNDTGRCIIDSNLFMRQDSEPEIITSKSQENVYYANTILNCRGTLNLRHGDHQYALNNFFVTTDKKFEYGGMFVWGSDHVIANNFFDLKSTLKDRGNAAIYLNPGVEGSEHALALDILIANNFFKNINGYAINFNPLSERRIAFAEKEGKPYQSVRNITLVNNVFYSKGKSSFSFFKDTLNGNGHYNKWINDFIYGQNLGISKQMGMNLNPFKLKNENEWVPDMSTKFERLKLNGVSNIPGIALDLNEIANGGIKGAPISTGVGPKWMTEVTTTYAKTGKLPVDIQREFDEVIKRRTK